MSEIAVAYGEQGAGIEHVNQAITQLDSMMQQNAALVEEQTAAASAKLQEQAQTLVNLMGIFILGNETEATAKPGSHANGSRASNIDPRSNSRSLLGGPNSRQM